MSRQHVALALALLLGGWTGQAAAQRQPEPPPDKDGAFVLTKAERSLEQIDEIYAKMPPLKYTPPADRWQSLPRTATLLGKGEGELRVVMLGDSIVNDTSRSSWEALVQRRYPRIKIVKVTCVRGGTGCWWYKEPGRVQHYVLEHRPDLLIIGGISHRDDTDSIREVIRQVRAARECDVLLMTGAFGGVNPEYRRQWDFNIIPQGPEYRARLMRLAKETRCAYLDLTAHWGKYVLDSGKVVSWFQRDRAHANEYGEQILGRILAAYLVPNPKDAKGGVPKARDPSK